LFFAVFAQSCGRVASALETACAVEDDSPIDLDGRMLQEIPDVTAPEMRRANLLLSMGCLEEARDLVASYVESRPRDPQGLYVVGRLLWIAATLETAERFIGSFVEEFPNFTSARVQLAGFRIDQNRLDEAQAILADAELESPNDLWIYMGRLRIEAQTLPTSAVRRRLLDIAEDSRFPPNARTIAARQLRRTQHVSPEEYGASFKAELTFQSAQPMACKASDYGAWLIDVHGRADLAREALEPYEGTRCDRFVDPHVLLAYAYFLGAADIAAGPTPANADLVQRADSVIAGDYAALASWVERKPNAARVEPFLLQKLDVDATDKYGRTRISNAVLLLNAPVVSAELERGADPNGRCVNNPLATYLSLMGTRKQIKERQDILRLLLQHGARPESIEWCKDPSNGDCGVVLLPIFREYGLGL
jgi:hypothetical protein